MHAIIPLLSTKLGVFEFLLSKTSQYQFYPFLRCHICFRNHNEKWKVLLCAQFAVITTTTEKSFRSC